MIKGFKEFISQGNAIDIAVGMVIGAAFTLVVTSLVDSVINPFIAGLVGRPDFSEVLQFTIGFGDNSAVVQPGVVLTALLNFLLVALALYLFIVVPMNKLNERRTKVETDTGPDEVALLTEIRDALVARGDSVPPGQN